MSARKQSDWSISMGDTQDKVSGRVKQAGGALAGDDELKREGEREERKGEVKEKFDDAVDSVQDKIDEMRDKVSRS
jgi:uncharacterized protein YjbJ (UPF0337 family)